MFKNYFTIAIRQLLRNRFYSSINILGLAIGLASALLIMLYVRDEMSYDQFHADKDRIYRVSERFRTGDGFLETGLTPSRLAQSLKEYFPHIEKTARMDYDITRFRIEYKDKGFLETSVTTVDPDFFKIFSFPILSGNGETMLTEPYTMVISDQAAQKYFGAQNPVGEMVQIKDPYDLSISIDIKVTGVFASMPHNSHFHKEFLISSATGDKILPQRNDSWGWTSHFTYIMLSPGQDVQRIAEALPEFTKNKFSEEYSKSTQFFIQPLTDIHLRSNLKEEQEANGDIRYVYIFSSIAAVIILLASINYMNLATARASKRAKEIGIRKVVGAEKSRIVYQFLGESMIVSFISLLLAFLMAQLGMPLFNVLSGKELELHVLQGDVLLVFTFISILVGILAGIYPALVLSSFKPVSVLKGGVFKVGSGSVVLRKMLVVLQFGMSTALIIGTIIIFQQWEFLQHKKMGISSDHVLVVPVSTLKINTDYEILKNEWLQNANVLNVVASQKEITARPGNFTNLVLKGSGEKFTLPVGIVDFDFFTTFDIPILEGRDFSKEFATDTLNSFIINESAAKLMGFESPVGQKIDAYDTGDGVIVGVVKDFHFESLHTQIAPFLFLIRRNQFNTMAIKVNSENLQSTIQYLEKVQSRIDPEATFQYSFLDTNIDNLYRTEARFFKVFTSFSVLAIFIACLGIFGLISFTTSQRTKEIGIRKVLGASVQSISMLLTRDFIKLVLVANLLAWPIAYYFMRQWLESFSYRIDIALWMFLVATFAASLVAVFTVSVQAIQAALANPVRSLMND